MARQNRIEHVVVLMLENRSFDHLFGYFPNVEGLQGKDNLFNLADPNRPEGDDNRQYPASAGAAFAIDKGQGPSHSLDGTSVQLCGVKGGGDDAHPVANSGFVLSYRNELRHDRVGDATDDDIEVVMKSFSPEQLPALNTLAREFVLCDQWFSELPGPTMPNRLYMHAATSAGYAHNDWKRTFDLRTIYDNLQENGKTWAVYSSDDNEVAKLAPANQNKSCFKPYGDSFVKDASAGDLPNYTFIIPAFGSSHGTPNTSMHAPNDVRPGDALVAEVYAALRGNEEAWSKTLFVVTFDEHGGFYDHVAPPSRDIPNPDGINSPAPDDHSSFAPRFDFRALGLRVPTILVSPWLPKGKVFSKQLQHTSVLATVKNLFELPDFLTKRDASAETFDDLLMELEAARTDCPETVGAAPPPESSALADNHPDHPANQPPDAVVKSLCEGWHAVNRKTGNTKGLPMDEPSTHHEAHTFLKAHVGHYLKHQAKQPKVEVAPKKRATGKNVVQAAKSTRSGEPLFPDRKPKAPQKPAVSAKETRKKSGASSAQARRKPGTRRPRPSA